MAQHLGPEGPGQGSARVSEAARLAEYSAAVRESSLKRLRAVPSGFESWRPHAGAMSFADTARHLIDADEWLFAKLVDEGLEPMTGRAGLADVETRDEYEALLDELERTGKRRRRLLLDMSREVLAREIFDARFGGRVSVWWIVVRGNLDHETHHRGQIATWLASLRRHRRSRTSPLWQ